MSNEETVQIGDGIISPIKHVKKDLYNCNCNTQKELQKQNAALLEALEKAKQKIECSQKAHERAAPVLVDEALGIIDAAIAAAKGE